LRLAETRKPMKTSRQLHRLSKLFTSILLMCAAGQSSHAATWTGGSVISNGWLDGSNWDIFAPPGPSDPVIFDSFGVTNVAGAVNNTVDGLFTISSLTYQAVGSIGFHTTFINPGASLNIVGDGGNALFVGTGTS